jgi:uncharacterized protein (TIGR02145 family)
MKHTLTNPATHFAMLLMALAMAFTFLACGKKPEEGSLTYEGKTYKTVKIGEQTWMAENLNFAANGGTCYDNDPANCDKYGRLYSWADAMAFNTSCNKGGCASDIQPHHRGICPPGWCIPSEADWGQLIDYVGGSSKRLVKAGLATFPAGGRITNGSFENRYGWEWWSTHEKSGTAIKLVNATTNQAFVGFSSYFYNDYMDVQVNIRCIKDNEKREEAIDDYSSKKIMTMTTEKEGDLEISLKGVGMATIDWGDGTAEMRMLPFDTYHNYSNAGSSSRAIKIAGENIISFECIDCELTNLDVSENAALTHLNCRKNQLTNLNLNMTSNASLTYLDINDNKLTGTALDALFKTLSKNAENAGWIDIGGNPGIGKCDRSTATKKGWNVVVDRETAKKECSEGKIGSSTTAEAVFLEFSCGDYCYAEFRLANGEEITFNGGELGDIENMKKGTKVSVTYHKARYWEEMVTGGECWHNIIVESMTELPNE